MGPDQGKKERTVFWPLLTVLMLIIILWYFLWYKPSGQEFFIYLNSYSYSRMLFILATVTYALLTSAILISSKKEFQKNTSYKSAIAQWARLSAFFIFSLVWIALLRFTLLQTSDDKEDWPADSYRFYILLFTSLILFFVQEQLSIALKRHIETKYISQFVTPLQNKSRNRVCVVSYILLVVLLMITNGLIKNLWLLLFSIVLLQILFPLLLLFCNDDQPSSSNEESDYKKWLVKETNEEPGN
jgi:hypothetical protein